MRNVLKFVYRLGDHLNDVLVGVAYLQSYQYLIVDVTEPSYVVDIVRLWVVAVGYAPVLYIVRSL